jgi:hypothetical protein
MSRAAHRGPLLTTIWRLHRYWYRLSDGRLGAKFQGWDVLLLTTTGRKSGARRSVILNYFPMAARSWSSPRTSAPTTIRFGGRT